MGKRIPTQLSPARVLGVLLLLLAGSQATATAARAGDLSDEAAECRSLLSLCRPAEAAFKKLQAVNAKVEHYQQLPKESRRPATLEAFSKLQAQQKAARTEFNNRLLETLEAVAAMRTQPTQLPACVHQCPNVLKSSFKVWK